MTLTEMAIKAKELGVSYGELALQMGVSSTPIEDYQDPPNTKICAICGMEFVSTRGNKKYCSEECRLAAQYANAKKKKESNMEKKAPVCNNLEELLALVNDGALPDQKTVSRILTAEIEAKKNVPVGAVAPEEPKVTRHSVLSTADSVVNGARADVYGGPEDSFQLIARLWEPYLTAKCISLDGACIEPEDVAVMMGLLKVARLAQSPDHEDSWVDLAGYAACGAEIACARGARA